MDEHDAQHQHDAQDPPDAHDPELTAATPAPVPSASDVASSESDAGVSDNDAASDDEPHTNVDLSDSHEQRLERLDAAEEANREKMEETETEDGQEKYAGGQIPAVSESNDELDGEAQDSADDDDVA